VAVVAAVFPAAGLAAVAAERFETQPLPLITLIYTDQKSSIRTIF
jgi:hypothetical protein